MITVSPDAHRDYEEYFRKVSNFFKVGMGRLEPKHLPLRSVRRRSRRSRQYGAAIAAIQVSAPGNPEEILEVAAGQIVEAQRNHEVDFAGLPEHFLFDTREIGRDPQSAAQFSAKALERLSEVCAFYKIWLLTHLIEEEKGHFYSTVYCLSPEVVVGKYRATHLWGDERNWATPGNDLPVFKTLFGNVCDDRLRRRHPGSCPDAGVTRRRHHCMADLVAISRGVSVHRP